MAADYSGALHSASSSILAVCGGVDFEAEAEASRHILHIGSHFAYWPREPPTQTQRQAVASWLQHIEISDLLETCVFRGPFDDRDSL
jgi:hypothetical protein